MKIKPHIWTTEEIQKISSSGWFYGLFKDENNKIRFGEIYPGWGEYCYCVTMPDPIYHPKSWYWAIKDLFTLRPC